MPFRASLTDTKGGNMKYKIQRIDKLFSSVETIVCYIVVFLIGCCTGSQWVIYKTNKEIGSLKRQIECIQHTNPIQEWISAEGGSK